MAERKSRLAQIYKSEKEKGGGIVSTLGKRALEKIDPRQMFDQGGLMAQLFPSIFKAYKATPEERKRIGSVTNITNNYFTQSPTQISEKLDNSSIIVDSKITAKNTMVLPAMSRDMNLMRQNIAKLVKISGGKPTYKTDLFFKGAKERESAYENLFKKESKKLTPISPTPEKQKDDMGALGFLGLFVKSFKDMKDSIVNSFKNIGDTILNGILTAFNINNILKAFGLSGTILSSIINFVSKIATNPFFIGLAAITGAGALFEYLRGKEDVKEKRFMELAERKSKGEVLTEIEEQEIKDAGSLKNRQMAIEKFGYDPVLGKSSDITRVEGIRRESELNRIRLEDLATEQLRKEGNIDPSIQQIKNKANEIEKQQISEDKSYERLESSRFQRLSPALTNLPETGAGAGRGDVLPPTKIPTPPPQSTSPTQVPKNPLLELIAKGEAVKDKQTGEYSYESMNQGNPKGVIVGSGLSTNVIGEKITDMTVGEILNRAPTPGMGAEERKNKKVIFAAGRYQIIPKTLGELVKQGKVSKDEKFTPELQDKLALDLIEKRGVNKLVTEGNLEEAQYRLAQEWASIAVPMNKKRENRELSTGSESFYGYGNKAKITGQEIVTALRNNSTLGNQLASVSAENTRAISNIRQPLIVNAPTTNNVQTPSNAPAINILPANVTDTDMARLLSRAI